jgi:hypothetical protein
MPSSVSRCSRQFGGTGGIGSSGGQLVGTPRGRMVVVVVATVVLGPVCDVDVDVVVRGVSPRRVVVGVVDDGVCGTPVAPCSGGGFESVVEYATVDACAIAAVAGVVTTT